VEKRMTEVARAGFEKLRQDVHDAMCELTGVVPRDQAVVEALCVLDDICKAAAHVIAQDDLDNLTRTGRRRAI